MRIYADEKSYECLDEVLIKDVKALDAFWSTIEELDIDENTCAYSAYRYFLKSMCNNIRKSIGIEDKVVSPYYDEKGNRVIIFTFDIQPSTKCYSYKYDEEKNDIYIEVED